MSPAAASAADAPVHHILGGGPALAGEYPAQGYLEIDRDGDGSFDTPGVDARCAGTLVAPRHLLTAAHCASEGSPLPASRFLVYMGDPNVSPPNAPGGYFTVVKSQVHEAYPGGPYGLASDVAVLTLSRPAPYQPTRLLDPGESQWWKPPAVARIIGWGRTAPGGATSALLLEADIPMLSDAACLAAFADSKPNPFDPQTMVCAGDSSHATCEGDSGGPLLVFDAGGELALAGVTSWGDACTEPGRPEAYARVAAEPLSSWVRARIPRAGFSSTPGAPREGEAVAFASTSTGPAGFDTFRWDLDGDGQLDDASGPTASRSFTRGDHSVALEASNALGDRSLARRTISVGASRPTDATAPRLASASVRPRTFAVSRGGRAERPVAAARRGTLFRYRLSEQARVVFTIDRALAGRRVGRRCVKPTRRTRGRRRCTRHVRFGRFARAGTRGANTVRYSGRIGRRAMRPGRYRATLVATDAARNRSRVRRLGLRVVRR